MSWVCIPYDETHGALECAWQFKDEDTGETQRFCCMAVHPSTHTGVLQLPDTPLCGGEDVAEVGTRNIAYIHFLRSFDLAASCNLRMLSDRKSVV